MINTFRSDNEEIVIAPPQPIVVPEVVPVKPNVPNPFAPVQPVIQPNTAPVPKA